MGYHAIPCGFGSNNVLRLSKTKKEYVIQDTLSTPVTEQKAAPEGSNDYVTCRINNLLKQLVKETTQLVNYSTTLHLVPIFPTSERRSRSAVWRVRGQLSSLRFLVLLLAA